MGNTSKTLFPPPQTDSLEEKNNERNRAETHKLSGIGEKDPEEKQEQLPPLKKSSPTSQQQSQQASKGLPLWD